MDTSLLGAKKTKRFKKLPRISPIDNRAYHVSLNKFKTDGLINRCCKISHD
jgi:predicted AAA+ superfamily ATPase